MPVPPDNLILYHHFIRKHPLAVRSTLPWPSRPIFLDAGIVARCETLATASRWDVRLGSCSFCGFSTMELVLMQGPCLCAHTGSLLPVRILCSMSGFPNLAMVSYSGIQRNLQLRLSPCSEGFISSPQHLFLLVAITSGTIHGMAKRYLVSRSVENSKVRCWIYNSSPFLSSGVRSLSLPCNNLFQRPSHIVFQQLR